MKLLLLSPGKRHAEEYRLAIAEFEQRLSTSLPIEWNFPSAGSKEEESKGMLKLIQDTDVVVLLDETGKDISSTSLADLLDAQLQIGTKRLVFIIGGAFGVSDSIKARANYIFRLSTMVFPHMLVRLILIEQLYRAWSIRTGGKYHHA